MPLDNTNSFEAAEAVSRDMSRASISAADATHPPISKTGGKLGQLVDTTCKSQICPAADAPTYRVSGKGAGKSRKSRAKTTGPGVARWLESAKFDWFQGVLPDADGTGSCVVGGVEERRAIRDAYEFLGQHGLHAGKQGSGGKGYATGMPFFVGRTGTAQVASVTSGSYTGGMPGLCLTGGDGLCAVLAPQVQAHWPDFRISRADVCIDLRGEHVDGLWDKLREMSRSFATSRKMGQPVTMGEESPEAGRTFYLGDRHEGDVFLRVYEKGRQMRGVKGVLDVPEDWVRIEFVMRNIDGDLKAAFGQLSPGDMIRTKIWPRKWLAEAVKTAGESDMTEPVAPIEMRRDHRATDARQTVTHGTYQYAGAFARVAYDEIMQEREAAEYARQLAGEEVQPLVRWVSKQHLTLRMAAVFLREVRAQDERLDAIIERYGIAVDETLEYRAMMAAEKMQAARLEDMRKRLAARRSVAEAVRYGDEEDVRATLDAVNESQKRLTEALNADRNEHEFQVERRRGRKCRVRRDYFAQRAMRKSGRSRKRVKA